MPAKIRLQRFGKKGKAFFHIVIADGRAPRDGKFIEKIGTYNPITNPATINIDNDKALLWLQKGAQPTPTCKAILSYRGVMYRNHLAKGVAKGAFTQEQAEVKYNKWLGDKEGKILGKVAGLSSAKQESSKKRFAAESASKQARAAKIIAKNTPPAEVAPSEPTEEGTTPEA